MHAPSRIPPSTLLLRGGHYQPLSLACPRRVRCGGPSAATSKTMRPRRASTTMGHHTDRPSSVQRPPYQGSRSIRPVATACSTHSCRVLPPTSPSPAAQLPITSEAYPGDPSPNRPLATAPGPLHRSRQGHPSGLTATPRDSLGHRGVSQTRRAAHSRPRSRRSATVSTVSHGLTGGLLTRAEPASCPLTHLRGAIALSRHHADVIGVDFTCS